MTRIDVDAWKELRRQQGRPTEFPTTDEQWRDAYRILFGPDYLRARRAASEVDTEHDEAPSVGRSAESKRVPVATTRGGRS